MSTSHFRRWISVCLVALAAILLFWIFAAKLTKETTSETHEEYATEIPQELSAKASKKSLRSGKNRHDLISSAKASIRGKVLDPRGNGLSNAQVCAWAQSTELSTLGANHAHCTTTSSSGSYHLENLIGVPHRVAASAAEYIPAVYTTGIGSQRREFVSLQLGKEVTEINIILNPGGVKIEGIIKDLSGGVLEGAQIVSSKWFSGTLAVALSKSDGTFQMWVSPGEIDLRASLDGYADGSQHGIAPGHRFELFLTPESVVIGKVISAMDGSPVAGAKIAIEANEWFSASDVSTYSDTRGNFRIEQLQPGAYQLSAVADELYGLSAETVHLGLGQTSDPIAITVHPAFYVSGQIKVVGGSGVCDEGSVELRDIAKQRDYYGIPDSAGSVHIRGILPGNYSVTVSCQGFLSAEHYPSIVIDTQSVQDLRWEVQKGRAIYGLVVDATGTPAHEITVVAQQQAINTWQRSAYSKTDEQGRFELTGLLSGTYTIIVWGERPSPKDPIEVKLDAEKDIHDIRIELAAEGVVLGSVRDTKGNPVSHVNVHIETSHGFLGGQRTMTGDDGTFKFLHAPVGHNRIRAMQGWSDTLRAPGTTDDDIQGQEIDVAAGQTTTVELLVETASGTISGQVVDETDAPIADAFVDATRESDSKTAATGGAVARSRWSNWSRQPVLTDHDGSFELTGLLEGQHTLRAYRKGGGEGFIEHIEVGSHSVKIPLLPTGSLAGSVLLAGGGFPQDFTLQIENPNTNLSRSKQFFRTLGKWSFSQLPAGTYTISVSTTEGTNRTNISLQEGEQKSGIELVLNPRVKVFGKVVDLETDEPVPGITLRFSEHGRSINFNSSIHKDNKQITDANGYYEIDHAPTGKTTIVTIPQNSSGYSFTWISVFVDPQKTTQELPPLRIVRERAKWDETGDLGFSIKDQESGRENSEPKFIVAVVRPGGPASQTELQEGDEIIRIDGHDITGENSYRYHTLSRVKPGTTVTLELKRGLTIKLVAEKS